MDLKSIVVAQIQKSVAENEINKEIARKKAEEEARKKAEEEEIRRKEDLVRFNLEKKVFEESFVREIMTVIINVINQKNEKISPLRERIFEIVRSNPHNTIKDDAVFLLEPAYSFRNNGYYIICLRYNDNFYVRILSFVISENNQISFYSSLFDYQTKSRVTLSSDKEEAATQIISYLMTD